MAIVNLTLKFGLDKDSLKKANAQIGKALKSGLKAGGLAAGAALGAVGGAAAVATQQTLEFAEESTAAMEGFRRETGLSEESVEDFGRSAKRLFAAGVGEGIDDIAESMATVNNVMQTGAEETENLTKKALVMRDVFDKDVDESVDGVKVLMDEFGLTADEAFDFMAEGIQKGLDRNGDFIDSIREYGGLFGDAGFEASQFFSVLETGAEGGVLGVDKISDAWKEAFIRLDEGGDEVTEVMNSMFEGGFENMRGFISEGKAQWGDYAERIVTNLNQIDDPLERQQKAVAIFGTAAEDLGVSFTEGLSTATTSMQDMAGAMDTIVEKNMTLGEGMETLQRQLVVALEPAAKELMPLLAEGIAGASDFLMQAQPIFMEFAGNLKDTLGPAIQIIGDSLSRMAAVFGIVGEDATGMDAALAILEGTLDLVVTGIEAVAVASHLLAGALEGIKALGEDVGEFFGKLAVLLGGNADDGLFGQGGALNILGFQGGGVVPGNAGQAVPLIAHGGEEIANPNIGQSITIGGEQFAVREAGKLASFINAQRQADMEQFVGAFTEAMN